MCQVASAGVRPAKSGSTPAENARIREYGVNKPIDERFGRARTMDFPARVKSVEEGPCEGFQINTGPISTARKIDLIDVKGKITLATSIGSLERNQNRTIEGQIDFQRLMTARWRGLGVSAVHCGIMAAFWCDFEGDIPKNITLRLFGTDLETKHAMGAVRDDHPDQWISRHLHDACGPGHANARAGRGGCPSVGHPLPCSVTTGARLDPLRRRTSPT